MPGVDERYLPPPDEPIHHKSFVSAVVLPLGVFHPHNRLATLHRYDALWAMYTPVSAHVGISDVLRAYVAQAIFPIIGRHLAIVEPAVTRNISFASAIKAPVTSKAIVAHLADWSRTTLAKCSRDSKNDECMDAGALLIAAYMDLEHSGLSPAQDTTAAKRWVKALRSAGYAFPTSSLRGMLTPPDISPRRPHTLNVHAAVQLNWGRSWEGVVPLWHAMHAAEYTQVTYHVQRRPDAANPSTAAGIYPRITHYLDDLPGVVSGYLDYQSAIQAWSLHDLSTDALLWTQDDAFTTRDFLMRWLQLNSSCVAVSDDIHYLPPDVTQWTTSDWSWAKEFRTQLAGKHFLETSERDQLQCVGRNLSKDGFAWDQNDVVAIRTGCNGTAPQPLFSLLQAASDAGLFLEIGWPNCIRCAFDEHQMMKYRLFTRWDHQRNNALD